VQCGVAAASAGEASQLKARVKGTTIARITIISLLLLLVIIEVKQKKTKQKSMTSTHSFATSIAFLFLFSFLCPFEVAVHLCLSSIHDLVLFFLHIRFFFLEFPS
jgi:NADH:ubiquinone oxidoreductase subunit 6 (subunit J)